MDEGQVVPALLASLLGEGVSTEQIERAVARVLDLPPGRLVSSLAGEGRDLAMVRAFVFEQGRLIERA